MITRLKVSNFKSLRNIDLTLGSLNVLVGPNMAGKSNILDVFRFLHEAFFPEARTQGILYALAQRGGVSEVLWKGGDDKLISLALERADEDDPNTKYIYELELIAGAGGFASRQKESLKFIRSGQQSDLISHEGGMSRLVNADGQGAGSIGSSEVAALQYATPNWDGYRFYEWVRNWHFYHLVPPAMKERSSMALGQALTPDGDNLSAWLMWLQTNSPESFRRINEVVCDIFPDVLQLKTVPGQDGNVHLATQETGLKRPINVWQASDGLLVLTALLSLIYAPSEPSGALFCIEEPENHLHPRLLETLVALLRQVQEEVRESKSLPAQIIVTTQSPYLVDQMSIDEIIWVERKNGETRLYRPANKAHLKKLVENKELGLGDLMFSGALGEEK